FHHLVRDHGPLHAVRDLEVSGVPVRLYVPKDAEALPVHVHLHGGGWWMGSLETVDPMARELAHVSGMAVVSVGYRLAPEHPYPAGLDDAIAVLTNLTEDVLGFRPTTLSIGGESAGGNLTAAACLRLRDEGGPALAAQWLDVPAVDLTGPEDDSMRAYGTGYGLEMAQLSVLTAWYGADVTDPHVSPALADDLTCLPPAIVTTGECDPVRDQGARYAEALQAAGNDVVYRCNPGQVHASSWFTALTEANAAWYDETVALLVARHQAVLAR
ncbi:MAG: alpha/beta hydrolase, partial [Actinomycetota bacterium]|nr:alpha/beta hydrolase [Actinomycetota bacterium]